MKSKSNYTKLSGVYTGYSGMIIEGKISQTFRTGPLNAREYNGSKNGLTLSRQYFRVANDKYPTSDKLYKADLLHLHEV